MFFKHLKYWIMNILGIKRKSGDISSIEKYNSIPYRKRKMRCICGWNRWKIKSRKNHIFECRKCGEQVRSR